MRKVRAIFFDLGDTLINSRIFGPNGELKAVEEVIERYHLGKPPSDYLSLAEEAGKVIGDLRELLNILPVCSESEATLVAYHCRLRSATAAYEAEWEKLKRLKAACA